MLIHDVGLASVYYSVWGVVDAINTSDGLVYHFPNHDKQKEIADGFLAKSGAGFSNVIGAIDGLVICILKPCLVICGEIECGQTNFRCHRKDKYGLNLQAICDHKLRIFWAEIKWPAATSDYMAWFTSSLYRALEDNAATKKIVDGFTIIGDNAYVKKAFMATLTEGYPWWIRGCIYFYLSQL